jgi:hypothetical protein
MTGDPEGWDRCAPWIQAALDEGGNTHTLDDVRKAIAEDRLVLRVFPHTAFLLEVIHYPQFSALRIVGCGGECNAALEEARAFILVEVPKITKAAGLRRYEARGRPGWARVLKEIGMRKQAFMFKEI